MIPAILSTVSDQAMLPHSFRCGDLVVVVVVDDEGSTNTMGDAVPNDIRA